MRKTPVVSRMLLACTLGMGIPVLVTAAMQVQDYQGVSYITGGVGLEERQELEGMAKDFNLKLVFAVQGGQYLGDVQVRIQDGQGKTVLEATSKGPWLYASLKPGTYTVLASDANERLEHKTQVGAGKQTELSFAFKDM